MPRDYELLPTNAASTESLLEPEEAEEADSVAGLHRRLARDPRFNPPPPATWKRVALILLVLFLFFLTFWLRGPKPKHVAKPDIEYEELYDKYIVPAPVDSSDSAAEVPPLHIARPGDRVL